VDPSFAVEFDCCFVEGSVIVYSSSNVALCPFDPSCFVPFQDLSFPDTRPTPAFVIV
jgi:hypothetical protein